jgi:hypothetical protein
LKASRTKQTADNNLIILEPIKKNTKTEMEINLRIFGSFGIGLSVLLFALIWPG